MKREILYVTREKELELLQKLETVYVGEYYDDEKQNLTFYFEKYNKHWSNN